MIELEDFLKRIEFVPRFKGRDLGDGVRIVTWGDDNELFPSMEFGTVNDNGQYLYYEIVDFGNGYKEGDIVNIDDPKRRIDVLDTRLSVCNMEEVCSHINKSLRRFYGRREKA